MDRTCIFSGIDSVYVCVCVCVCVCRDIPVDMKYVAEPHMHSMPAVTVHPNGGYVSLSLFLSLSLSPSPPYSRIITTYIDVFCKAAYTHCLCHTFM